MTGILQFMRKNKLIVLGIALYSSLFLFFPAAAQKSFDNSLYYLFEMLSVLPVIFMLTVVIEAWIPKEVIMKSFGEKSGFKGNLLSLALGSISAGPIYAAFPISKTLINKGASITNIVIILSSWAVIKLPMLANEAKFLGPDFMAVRWVLTVLAIWLMATLIGRLVRKKDLPQDRSQVKQALRIKSDYCTGCGLCVRMMPMIYSIEQNKATLLMQPPKQMPEEKIIQVVQKCPTQAIVFDPKQR